MHNAVCNVKELEAKTTAPSNILKLSEQSPSESSSQTQMVEFEGIKRWFILTAQTFTSTYSISAVGLTFTLFIRS